MEMVGTSGQGYQRGTCSRRPLDLNQTWRLMLECLRLVKGAWVVMMSFATSGSCVYGRLA